MTTRRAKAVRELARRTSGWAGAEALHEAELDALRKQLSGYILGVAQLQKELDSANQPGKKPPKCVSAIPSLASDPQLTKSRSSQIKFEGRFPRKLRLGPHEPQFETGGEARAQGEGDYQSAGFARFLPRCAQRSGGYLESGPLFTPLRASSPPAAALLAGTRARHSESVPRRRGQV